MRSTGGSVVALDRAWDALFAQSRFRLVYPSEAVVRFLARRLGSVEDRAGAASVLDVGCGAGRHLAAIERAGHRSFGLDYSWEALAHAAAAQRSQGSVARLARAAMQALPLRSGAFDAAVAYGVLYYSDEAGYRLAVDELWRVLKPGGALLVVSRTTRDYRYGRGRQLEPGTFVADDDATNEAGMIMHFLTREAIDAVFGHFASYTVDWVDQSVGGGAVLNSDWVIEATK